jgi:hypothetical protein
MPLLPSIHNVLRPTSRKIAGILTAFYLVIALSPLAPLAMHSKVVAHAVTGECSGDCNICGCSPENRANQTCCCAKKRQLQAHAHEDHDDGTPDCCKKKTTEKKTVIACGCPCGSGKQIALATNGTPEVLPFHFSERIGVPSTDTTFSNLTHRLASRYGDPPDPPPQNS